MQKNTFFGQMSSFITNMMAFQLPARDISEFREKMFIMSELEEEQKDMLRALCPDDPGQETEASLSDRFESFKERGRSFLQSVSRSLSIEVGVTDTG